MNLGQFSALVVLDWVWEVFSINCTFFVHLFCVEHGLGATLSVFFLHIYGDYTQ